MLANHAPLADMMLRDHTAIGVIAPRVVGEQSSPPAGKSVVRVSF